MDLWPADRLPLFLPGRDLMRSVPLLGWGVFGFVKRNRSSAETRRRSWLVGRAIPGFDDCSAGEIDPSSCFVMTFRPASQFQGAS
jgi:hypothetical protein